MECSVFPLQESTAYPLPCGNPMLIQPRPGDIYVSHPVLMHFVLYKLLVSSLFHWSLFPCLLELRQVMSATHSDHNLSFNFDSRLLLVCRWDWSSIVWAFRCEPSPSDFLLVFLLEKCSSRANRPQSIHWYHFPPCLSMLKHVVFVDTPLNLSLHADSNPLSTLRWHISSAVHAFWHNTFPFMLTSCPPFSFLHGGRKIGTGSSFKDI